MTVSIISTVISTSVTLCSTNYASHITITNAGQIVPSDDHTVPLYGPAHVTGAVVLNYGFVGSDGNQSAMGFEAPATLFNHGEISDADGVLLAAGGAIFNFAHIDGRYAGVEMNAGTLDNSGTISGTYWGVRASRAGSIQNTGLITCTSHSGPFHDIDAVFLSGGSQLNNEGGTISGGQYGVYGYGPNTVTNTGLIAASGLGSGVKLSINSTLDNRGTIYGYFGAALAKGDSASNAGQIIGKLDGVSLVDGITNNGVIEGVSQFGVVLNFAATGTVINHGSIFGNAAGIHGTSPIDTTLVSIYNDGLIAGASIAIDLHGQIDLTVGVGGRFSGAVTDEGGTGMLVLTGATASTLDMGGSFSGFDAISFASGASWVLAGTQAELAAGQDIAGFGGHDTLVLESFAARSKTFVSGKGLELSDGTSTVTLGISGDFSTADFTLATTPDSTEIVVCYLRGTEILTQAGEIPIEALRIGDIVVAHGTGLQRIKWIGRQSYARRFLKNDRDKLPVRIKAGALAKDVPSRDLYVSPGHSMLLGDTLVLAKALVNGITITQGEAPDEVHYYNIELERHDCILAAGAWAETYADCPGMRSQFHNAGTFWKLYPNYITPEEPQLCRPRPLRGPRLDAVLRPVVASAEAGLARGTLRGWVDRITPDGAIEGWAQDMSHPDLPVLLEISFCYRTIGSVLACDYRGDLKAAGIAEGRCSFSFRPTHVIPFNCIELIEVRRAVDGALLPYSNEMRAFANTTRHHFKIAPPFGRYSLRAR